MTLTERGYDRRYKEKMLLVLIIAIYVVLADVGLEHRPSEMTAKYHDSPLWTPNVYPPYQLCAAPIAASTLRYVAMSVTLRFLFNRAKIL